MVKPGLVVLVVSYVAFVSIGLPDTVLGVAWPSLRATFGIPPSAMGAVLASGMGGYFLSGLGAGNAVRKFGVGGLLTLSSALVAMALFGYALAPTWTVFFPIGAVWGVGSGAIDAALNGYAARHFSVRHVNWLHACWGIGASIGPAVMTFFIASGFGYRIGYALLGTVLGSMAVLFFGTRRRWDDTPSPSSTSPATPAVDDDHHRASPPSAKPVTLGRTLCSGLVWLQALLFLLYTGVESTVGQWCFSWLREQRGLAVEAAGSWTSAYWASLTVGRIVLGSFIGRVGPDRMLRLATLSSVVGIVSFVSVGGLLGRLGLLLLGASLAPMFPTLMARTPDRIGDDLAHHAVGLQVSAGTLGSALGPSAVGFLVAQSGIGAFGKFAVAVAIALLLMHELLLAMTRRARTV
ncbi:MAG: MFS transporter [Polyangiaceae bacterium]